MPHDDMTMTPPTTMRGILGAMLMVVATTADDAVWLSRYVSSTHYLNKRSTRWIHALLFVLTLEALAVGCCLVSYFIQSIIVVGDVGGVGVGVGVGVFGVDDGEKIGEEEQEDEVEEIVLGAIGAGICWFIAIFLYVKKMRKRRRKRRRRGQQMEQQQVLASATNSESEYGSINPSEGGDNNEEAVNMVNNIESMSVSSSSSSYHFTRWNVAAQVCTIGWIETGYNLADAFTKRLAEKARDFLFGEWTY